MVPILIDNTCIGAINIEGKEIDAYTNEDVQLLETLAQFIASATNRLNKEEKEEDFKKRLTALHETSLSLGEASTADQVAAISLATLDRIFSFEYGQIGFIEEKSYVNYSTIQRSKHTPLLLSLDGPGIIIRAIKTKQIQLVNDVSVDPDYIWEGTEQTNSTKSELVVPILLNDICISFINIESKEINAYTKEDVQLLETLAQFIASAVSRLREAEHLKSYQMKLEALHNSTAKLGEANSINEVSESITEIISDILGYKISGVGYVEGENFVYNKSLFIGFPNNFTIPLDSKSVMVRTIKTKTTQYVPDVSMDPDYIVTQSMEQILRSTVCTPVIVNDEVIGGLTAGSAKLDDFTEEDIKLIETLAQHVASAVSRLRENEHIQTFQKQLEALHTSSMKLAEATSYEEIAAMTTETLSQTLGHGFGEIGFIEDDRFVFYASTRREFDEKPFIPLEAKSVIVRSIKTGKVQIVVDVTEDPYYSLINPSETPLLSELCYPILVDDIVVGAINIESPKRDAYSQDDVRLIGTLAQQVASEIKRLDSEVEIREREARYRSLFENSLEGILITTSDGIIKEINPTGVALFGYDSPEELVGKEASDFYVNPEQRLLLMDILNTTGQTSNFELDIFNKKGQIRHMSAAINTTDLKGESVIESYLRDITEEKKLAEELKTYTGNLEIIAEERAQDYRSLSDNLHIHATSLSKAETIDDIAQITKNAIQQIFGLSRVDFGVIENNSLLFLREDKTKSIPISFDGPGITVRAAKTGKTQLVNDTLLDPGYISIDTARAISRSELVVPLVVQDTVMGIIDIGSVEVNAFNEQHARAFKDFRGYPSNILFIVNY